MATDLSDEQIERLLSEAESRLAGLHPQTVAAPKNTKPKAEANSALIASTAKLPSGQLKLPQDFSVRVPEKPRTKTKQKDGPDNAGENWFNMPKTSNDPQMKRDLQILKLRDVIALGKQHFKKDTRKDPFPKYAQVGTIIEGPTDFYSGRLSRKERKRTLAEEVLASGTAVAKFRTKYDDIQERARSGRKAHYKKAMAKRRKGK